MLKILVDSFSRFQGPFAFLKALKVVTDIHMFHFDVHDCQIDNPSAAGF